MGRFESTVLCMAPASEVYRFLASGAKTNLRTKSADPVALRVSLKKAMGGFSWGEIIDCTVTSTEMGSRVLLEGRPVLVTNITANIKGAVMMVQEALIREFGSR